MVVIYLMSEQSDQKITSDLPEGNIEKTPEAFMDDSAEIVLKNQYIIHAKENIEEFSHSYATAYEASEKDRDSSDYIAIVMKGHYPARQKLLYPYFNLNMPDMIELVDWGVVEWKKPGMTRFVLIYKDPKAVRLMLPNQPKCQKMTEERVKKTVIVPISNILQNISDRGIFHGHICPTNIFLSENDQIILGDCLSAFPGALQNILYETAIRSMCSPCSRGVGTVQDEIYSLGVTVAILLRGENLFLNTEPKKIIESKLSRGSFSLLTDGMRFTSSMSEFLRGTLADHVKDRWDIEQLIAWTQGTSSQTKARANNKKSMRSIEFNNKKYYRPELLAKDFFNNPAEAIHIIEDGTLAKWVERSLKQQDISEALSEAISRASVGGKTSANYSSKLISYVSMALHPMAPIRYKDITFFPDGLANGLIEAILSGRDTKVYVDIIKNRYAWTWLGFKENIASDTMDSLRIFDSCSKIISNTSINKGLERCLYELSSDVPCLSPLFKDKYVMDPQDMIVALDGIANTNDSSHTLIDRHIASFISCRDTKDQSGLLSLIQGGDIMRRSLALITFFQNIQIRYHKKPLVSLTKRLALDAERVVKRYYNVDLANNIRKKIKDTAQKGDITSLLGLIDNPQTVNQDKNEFDQARHEYALLKQEQEKINKHLDNNKSYGYSMGRELAAVISGVLSCILTAAMLLLALTGNIG